MRRLYNSIEEDTVIGINVSYYGEVGKRIKGWIFMR
jgi:hypothetical protein